MGGFIGWGSPISSAVTREWMGWQPAHQGLVANLEEGRSFASLS